MTSTIEPARIDPARIDPARIDMVVPELHEHDATSTHARRVRDLLEDDGHRVRFVLERPSPLESDVALLDSWIADADLTVLQHSIGSRAASEIARRGVPVVVNYHNVTPFEFLEAWEPDQIQGLRWGRDQLWELRPHAIGAIADSHYNARELHAVGFERVMVAPVLFSHRQASDGVAPLAHDGPTLLFVGRLTPNKAQQDLVAALAMLRARGVSGRLVLVGGSASDAYERAIERLARRLDVADALVRLETASAAELAGWYEVADVFVCTSEHEGFCVPAVEAMAAGVPVVAHAAAAVPETVADAGLVLHDKSPLTIATAIERVLTDQALRATLVARGRERAAALGARQGEPRMRAVLAEFLQQPVVAP